MPPPSLCKELQQKAEKELNEVPGKIQENLDHVKKWLSEQPHLKAKQDEQSLINFLRGSKYDLKKTKERIEVFYTCKTTVPEFFFNRDPLLPEIQIVLNRRLMTVLPETVGSAGPRLILNRAEHSDPNCISVTTYGKFIFMILDILCIEDPNSTIAGMSLIVDLQGLSYRYATQMTPRFLKSFIYCLQNAYPVRVKAFYFINAPSFFIAFYNVVKIFFSEKLRKRVHFYSNVEDCYDDIPRSVFPREYGGEQAFCDEISDQWKLKVEGYRDWFLNDEKFCSNESRRPKNSKTSKGLLE